MRKKGSQSAKVLRDKATMLRVALEETAAEFCLDMPEWEWPSTFPEQRRARVEPAILGRLSFSANTRSNITPGRDAIHGREETAVMLDIRKFIETAGLYLDTNEWIKESDDSQRSERGLPWMESVKKFTLEIKLEAFVILIINHHTKVLLSLAYFNIPS